MDRFLSLLIPAYLQWKGGTRLKVFLWYLPFLVLFVWMLRAFFQPYEVKILLIFYFLTAFSAMLDFYFHGDEDLAGEPQDNHKVWEEIMTVYLKNDFQNCVKLSEKHLKQNKKDPLTHYMLARLYSQMGEVDKTKKSLKKCRKFDKQLYLLWECDRLQKNI